MTVFPGCVLPTPSSGGFGAELLRSRQAQRCQGLGRGAGQRGRGQPPVPGTMLTCTTSSGTLRAESEPRSPHPVTYFSGPLGMIPAPRAAPLSEVWPVLPGRAHPERHRSGSTPEDRQKAAFRGTPPFQEGKENRNSDGKVTGAGQERWAGCGHLRCRSLPHIPGAHTARGPPERDDQEAMGRSRLGPQL